MVLSQQWKSDHHPSPGIANGHLLRNTAIPSLLFSYCYTHPLPPFDIRRCIRLRDDNKLAGSAHSTEERQSMNTNELPHGYRPIAEAPLYAINLSAIVICIETGLPAKPNVEGYVRLTVDGKQIRRSVNAILARAFPAELLAAITLPGEQWLTCPNFTDYKVSTLARVWSAKKAILLAPGTGTTGYPAVCLPLAGSFPSIPVHILVANAFLGPCPEGMHVKHIDRDRANAALSNLRHAFPPRIDPSAAVALHLSGASVRATAQALGCEKKAVYRALRAKGFKSGATGRPQGAA
ncbi:hypothetical protein HLH89_28710 [Rhizobium laguerreae]|uniref:HNH endonuclease signature motif containing protein n=1 Tax=Rhizobium laguerreae TaxID=1076926 RepID=UPI0014794AB1|nr:HNH endonuclease signature motif containing protein [Rhizobium laguerreae]NNH84980.1 hypothetical protein [Rhizobium laguerreae]